MVDLDFVREAADRIAGRVARTPLIRSEFLSRQVGGDIWLKLDTLQVTGAFKERGAANRLALLTPTERAAGVVAISAGNHAQAVARHASLLGIRAVIVMPAATPSSKVSRTAGWGAEVVLHGSTLIEAADHARVLAAAEGLSFIHPYDDDAIIAGQGTMALEIVEQAPMLDRMAVPLGGGGLLAGCIAGVRAAPRPVRVFGVEVESYAAFTQALAGEKINVGGMTIAEGIAVQDIGAKPLEMIRASGTDVLTVSEHAIEDAIALLAEEAKLIAEGAGAAGVAAVLAFPELFRNGHTAIPICGANIDNRALANVLQRVMVRDGRLLRLVFDIPDRPGILGDIATRIGGAGANIIEVSHHRLFTSPDAKSARLEVMIEARDAAHGARVVALLEESFSLTVLE
ncbi:threonine ammonia-lyase [Sphingopyxis granuli]|uniref:threonine ammonia-lyase n=1 Tax=Sphingopyxis granuli TaxID=267128 RepID=UPI00301E39F8